MWTHFLDKGRGALHRLSTFLGEGSQVQPTSSVKSKSAKQSLQLDVASLRHLLPYESVDEEGIVHNKKSIGFALQLMPASGADEALVKSLAELVKNKLPNGCDCTVYLYKNPYISNQLYRGFSPFLEQGGIYKTLAEMSINYHINAVHKGYKNNRNISAQLVDYRVYLFFSIKRQPSALSSLLEIKHNITSELQVAGLHYAALTESSFLTLLRTLVSPNLDEIEWPLVTHPDDALLSETIPCPSTLVEIANTHIDIDSSAKDGNPTKTRVVCAQINKWPQQFALWQSPDLFSNLLKPEHGISCPFLISFSVRGVNQDTMRSLAKRKAKKLNNNSNAIQNFLNPSAREEQAEWNFAYNESVKENIAILPTFYNLILFTTEASEREHVARAIGSYRQMGFELTQSRATQWVRYLASLPFFITEGVFSGLESLGLIKKMSHYNVANMMPIIAEFKGARGGMLLPTHRHQLAYLDFFDDQNLPITNYNVLTVGSSGAGKSMFQQAQLFCGAARGETIFVIDLGESYKHLCAQLGGTYIDASNFTINPFTLFDFEGSGDMNGKAVENYIQIRDLLAIMASPHVELSDIQKSFLLTATLSCWREKGRASCMDDVIEQLRHQACSPESKDDPRLHDLIILLKPFGREGLYGHLCNGETKNLTDAKFVVFEMGGLASNRDLLTIMMFVMIVVIQGQFYQADRRIKKRCVLDEAWRFLTEGSNATAANFIEQGFRTARKYNGGFTVITQYLADTDKTIQGRAIAASSDIKIIMRQGNFKHYLSDHPQEFSPLQQEMIASFGEAKGAGFSNMMVQYGTSYTFHRYFADPFTRILFSSDGQEFGEVNELLKSGLSTMEAVSQIAKKYYGDEL